MRFSRGVLWLSSFALTIFLGFKVFAYGTTQVLPIVTVWPDDPPTHLSFFFAGGGPLERFTSKPDSWYALYRAPLAASRPYAILLSHEDDPTRIKVFALDRSPFDKVSMKVELRMKQIEGHELWRGHSRTYEAVVSLPDDASVPGIYLLVEWTPPMVNHKPLPVSMQILPLQGSSLGEGGWRSGWKSIWRGGSPLESQRPVVLPVPRWNEGKGRNP
jgi:hypothetical protein